MGIKPYNIKSDDISKRDRCPKIRTKHINHMNKKRGQPFILKFRKSYYIGDIKYYKNYVKFFN